MMAAWRPMCPADLGAVERIADAVHADFPEAASVLAERLALFPDGCLMTDGGYVIAHPGRRGAPPALDTLLGALDPAADVLHWHDVALLPGCQGHGLGTAALLAVLAIAAAHALPAVSLVAVHGTRPYWARARFVAEPASAALQSYGEDAVYMVRPVG